MESPRKSLGQHWLKDESALRQIIQSAALKPNDTVLEIGPGLGTLTRHLVKRAKQVIAVELDHNLALQLPQRIVAKNLKVVEGDILKFNLAKLPKGYKMVANIPYYLTGNLLKNLVDSTNPPSQVVLLLQKEVAQRVAAGPGKMSLMAVGAQIDYEVRLDKIVPAQLFTPRPKVDSQIVILKKRLTPLFSGLDKAIYMRIVKAGFSQRRKKLRSSLSAGLRLPKGQVDGLLNKADVSGDLRAESLTLEQWYRLYTQYQLKNNLRSLLS